MIEPTLALHEIGGERAQGAERGDRDQRLAEFPPRDPDERRAEHDGQENAGFAQQFEKDSRIGA